ncbi:MAG: Uma2 family endonuclease [Gemmataceae bacterium]|nr:Uma2 family endonuclease [Gemmataceae bacterium]
MIVEIDTEQAISLRQFDQLPDQHRFELVDGMVEEKHMGSLSSWVGGELYAHLRAYCREHRFGWVWHADAGFDCFHSDTVRFPDVAVMRYGRLLNEELPDGHLETPPDLAAEVVSPNDRIDDLKSKLVDYRKAGVRLVWLIFPALRIARVHRPDRTITELAENEFLTGEGVLPGFKVLVSDLFPVRPVPSPPPSPPAEGA